MGAFQSNKSSKVYVLQIFNVSQFVVGLSIFI